MILLLLLRNNLSESPHRPNALKGFCLWYWCLHFLGKTLHGPHTGTCDPEGHTKQWFFYIPSTSPAPSSLPIISHTGKDFCHLLPPALKTPMASSQLLYAYTAEGGLLLIQKLQSSSRLANPASFSALWGLIHIFMEVWALWESIHPWLLSFCPRTLCSVSLHVILTHLSQLIILDIILNINNFLSYIKLPI